MIESLTTAHLRRCLPDRLFSRVGDLLFADAPVLLGDAHVVIQTLMIIEHVAIAYMYLHADLRLSLRWCAFFRHVHPLVIFTASHSAVHALQ